MCWQDDLRDEDDTTRLTSMAEVMVIMHGPQSPSLSVSDLCPKHQTIVFQLKAVNLPLSCSVRHGFRQSDLSKNSRNGN